MFFDKSIHDFDDARRLAQRRLPWMVFDYIDGAASDGSGEALNRARLRAIRLQPRVLNPVEKRSVAVSLFGKPVALPFGIAPMGLCNLAAPRADLMLAGLAARHQIPLGVSTAASTSLERLIEAAEGNAWFQLYVSGDAEGTKKLVERTIQAGYETLILTVDVPEVGRRPRELRRGFKMPFKIGIQQFVDFACHPGWSLSTLRHGRPELANFGGKHGAFDRTSSRAGADWAFLDRLRADWPGKLVVKGVLSVEDALKLKAAGVDAIQVSSHGGRQLASAPLPIDVLPAMRQALGPSFSIFYDSGLRSGEDIIKAYALGADFVFMGRPFSLAIAANGEHGLTDLTAVFAQEASITLAQLGLTTIDQVDGRTLSTKFFK